jgi:hypothetical protein
VLADILLKVDLMSFKIAPRFVKGMKCEDSEILWEAWAHETGLLRSRFTFHRV